jgi:hypothetical protein
MTRLYVQRRPIDAVHRRRRLARRRSPTAAEALLGAPLDPCAAHADVLEADWRTSQEANAALMIQLMNFSSRSDRN